MNKKNKSILIGLSIFVFIGFLVWLGMAGDKNQVTVSEYSQSSLSGGGQNFEFGTINMQDGKVAHEFEIKNEDEEAVVIKKVYTSCMCTSAYIYDATGKEYGEFGMQGHGGSPLTKVIINPGETVIVKAVYDPAAHGPSGVGLAERSIYVETNSAQSPKMEFSFTAMVKN